MKNQPENPQEPEKKEPEKLKKKADDYTRFMGAGFQIVAPVILGVLLGRWLDKHFETSNSIYTIILSSVMIVVALYQFLRQFFKS